MTKKGQWASGDAGAFLQGIGADVEGMFSAKVAAIKARESGTDKASMLPPGPWQSEPDSFNGVDPATGLAYFVRRMLTPYQGHLCGYVESPNHKGRMVTDAYEWCDVHGDVTFCGESTELGAGKVYVGFDCAHSFDVSPGMPEDCRMLGAQYRDIEYVKAECMKLAAQLHDMQKGRVMRRDNAAE